MRPSTFVGEGLLVGWALLLYYLVTNTQAVYDARKAQFYAAAVLLWLALTLWGVARIAFVFIRAALARQQPPTGSGNRRPSSDSRFTASYEDDHDDHTDRDDEERNDSTYAPR